MGPALKWYWSFNFHLLAKFHLQQACIGARWYKILTSISLNSQYLPYFSTQGCAVAYCEEDSMATQVLGTLEWRVASLVSILIIFRENTCLKHSPLLICSIQVSLGCLSASTKGSILVTPPPSTGMIGRCVNCHSWLYVVTSTNPSLKHSGHEFCKLSHIYRPSVS